ncbi:fatty-acid amide hydrolase 2-A-like isoform X3 [Leptopilina heterotoma]|uniref:fatty-acid amide hydrolase 2-A-like isoform X3 n=1 Tax=Leptopilina heterotoma TaxID=63436 RepID=UPI001CA81A88|nr:fatty-acid amide hydrolase 2-A-like isoform X3 [Leptopilina heterotoma]
MELTVRLAMIILKLITKILQPIYWFVNSHRPKQLPAIKNPLLLLSAKELAKKIRNREISSEAVVKAYIERIIAVNPQINAVIENRFNEATKEAKICDNNLDSGVVNIHTLEREQPLYGVPFSVKEACALKGCSFTACTLSRKDEKAPEDGEAVKLMKLAGAIPLCVTNTPEMCSGFDSSNLIHGSTNNPYDTRRIAGGSSGGEPNMNELKDVYEISTAMFFCMADIPRILLNPDDPKNEKNPFIELGKALFGFSQHTKNAILMGIFKDTKGFLYESRLDYYRERAAKLQTAFENMLGTNGVLIVPTYPSPALLRNQSFLYTPGGSYCILFNIFGFPSTQVPMGLNEQGLPIGFQLIANKNQDRLCLAVAQELEKEFGGWIAPSSRKTTFFPQ